MDWLDIADVPFRIDHAMSDSLVAPDSIRSRLSDRPDQSLPEHLPEVVTLRAIFSQYLDFDAVPRRSFFEYLRHFTADELEREKLDEFLSREGAVGVHPSECPFKSSNI